MKFVLTIFSVHLIEHEGMCQKAIKLQETKFPRFSWCHAVINISLKTSVFKIKALIQSLLDLTFTICLMSSNNKRTSQKILNKSSDTSWASACFRINMNILDYPELWKELFDKRRFQPTLKRPNKQVTTKHQSIEQQHMCASEECFVNNTTISQLYSQSLFSRWAFAKVNRRTLKAVKDPRTLNIKQKTRP